MFQLRPRGLLLAGTLLAGLLLAVPEARPDDPPPSDSGSGRSPGNDEDNFRAPEKSLMPEAMKSDNQDLDGSFAFEYLSRMAGDWKTEDGAIAATFRLTAAGSAIVETLFPESGGETTTLYHLDGQNLVAVTFAPGGQQPRLKFDPRRSFSGKYWFVLSGGTGFDKSRDSHLQEKTLQFTGLNRIDLELSIHNGKERGETRTLHLTRGQ